MHKPDGAGGTKGGTGSYIIGLLMMCVGAYLFLSKIIVTTGAFSQGFGMGTRLYSLPYGSGGGFGISGGMILIPFVIGVVMIFWNSKNMWGWILSGFSIIALMAGIIINIRMTLMPMSAFDILVLLVLMGGGAGMFFRSLKDGANHSGE